MDATLKETPIITSLHSMDVITVVALTVVLLYSKMQMRLCFTVAVFLMLLRGLCVTVGQAYSIWHETVRFKPVAVGNLLQRLKGRAQTVVSHARRTSGHR